LRSQWVQEKGWISVEDEEEDDEEDEEAAAAAEMSASREAESGGRVKELEPNQAAGSKNGEEGREEREEEEEDEDEDVNAEA
jgi:hypothetical protein